MNITYLIVCYIHFINLYTHCRLSISNDFNLYFF
nr:MAG TPA: hypothetical protein [Caudoviricetes sp.]